MYEAANHRLIGAISELAEAAHSIAAPDGQPEVNSQHAHFIHTRTHFTRGHMERINADRLTEGILIPTIHTCA